MRTKASPNHHLLEREFELEALAEAVALRPAWTPIIGPELAWNFLRYPKACA